MNKNTSNVLGFVSLVLCFFLGCAKTEDKKISSLIESLRCEMGELDDEVVGKLVKAGKAAVPALIEALKDKDERLRSHAAHVLGRIGDSRAVEPLIEMLNDENMMVRAGAADALGRLKDGRAAKPLVAALKAVADGEEQDIAKDCIVAALVSIGKPAVGPLIQTLCDKNATVRADAAYVLGKIGDKSAIVSLVELFKDDSAVVRLHVALALSRMPDKKALRALIAALRDENPGVRKLSALALGKIKERRATDALMKALKDENCEVRELAVKALGKIRDEKAILPLIEALRDEDSDVGYCAGAALGNIGKPAVEPLIRELTDVDEDVRRFAAIGLGLTGEKRVVKYLVEALGDEHLLVQIGASKALHRIGAPALAPLIEAIKDRSCRIRVHAIITLGDLGSKRAVKPLIDALRDEDREIRDIASFALEKITGQDFGRDYKKWRDWWEKNKDK
jgi:HEAT repeat protein